MREMRNANKILAVKNEGKILLGMRDTSKIDLKKIGWKGVDWIHLAQNND
jgi:hypothetical protein